MSSPTHKICGREVKTHYSANASLRAQYSSIPTFQLGRGPYFEYRPKYLFIPSMASTITKFSNVPQLFIFKWDDVIPKAILRIFRYQFEFLDTLPAR